MKRSAVGLMALLAMVVLVGCNRPIPRKPGAVHGDPVAIENYPNVVAEGGLDDWLVISRATVRARDDQPMSVSVPVRNGSDRQINVQYRFEFFEADGRPLDTTARWRYMLMPSATQVFLEGAALDTSAVDWRLIIRPAR